MQESKVAGRPAVKVPGHPRANNRGYVLRSRFVMEQKLGRFLRSDEQVHHKDQDETNDSPDNLEILTPRDHGKLHSEEGVSLIEKKLDYELLQKLKESGLGYRKMARATSYPIGSIKYAFQRGDLRAC